MAAIVIVQKATDLFDIQIYRDEIELEDFLAKKDTSSFFCMKKISRNSMQQIERYFRRMLTEEYFIKLQEDPGEEIKIRRLYEIGARR